MTLLKMVHHIYKDPNNQDQTEHYEAMSMSLMNTTFYFKYLYQNHERGSLWYKHDAASLFHI